MPSERVHQTLSNGHDDHLAHRAQGRADCQGSGAPGSRIRAGNGPEQHREGRPGQADTGKYPRAEREADGRAGQRHHGNARGKCHRAHQHDGLRAVAVSQPAGDWPAQAPDEVLDADAE